jgi:hypothetical protein
MSNLNIQLENEQSIHNNSQIRSNNRINLKRKLSNDFKLGRRLHEIRKKFYVNSDETKLICEICEQSYVINTTTTNLKKHFEKFHKDDYIEILNKELAKKNNQSLIQTENNQQELENNQQEPIEKLFQEEINKKRRKYKRIILENVIIEDDLFNLFVTGLEAENIIIQK